MNTPKEMRDVIARGYLVRENGLLTNNGLFQELRIYLLKSFYFLLYVLKCFDVI